MLKCYETERKSAILKSEFHFTFKKKKLKQSSIHVDLNMSFFFVCLFFPMDRRYREL